MPHQPAARVAGSAGSYQIRPGLRGLDRLKLWAERREAAGLRLYLFLLLRCPEHGASWPRRVLSPRFRTAPPQETPGDCSASPGKKPAFRAFGMFHLEAQISQGAERCLELLLQPQVPKLGQRGRDLPPPPNAMHMPTPARTPPWSSADGHSLWVTNHSSQPFPGPWSVGSKGKAGQGARAVGEQL